MTDNPRGRGLIFQVAYLVLHHSSGKLHGVG
jgi:hypothetical protein